MISAKRKIMAPSTVLSSYILAGLLLLSESQDKFLPNLPVVNYQITRTLFWLIKCILVCYNRRCILAIFVTLQGEYRLVFETLSPCEPTKNHQIQFNIYFSKKSSNSNEIKGNITGTTYFDDNSTVSTNLHRNINSILFYAS